MHRLSDILRNRHPKVDVYNMACPFCKEWNPKKPCFIVDTYHDTYECTKCQAKGDSISYLMAQDSLPFEEAYEKVMGRKFLRSEEEVCISVEDFEEINTIVRGSLEFSCAKTPEEKFEALKRFPDLSKRMEDYANKLKKSNG